MIDARAMPKRVTIECLRYYLTRSGHDLAIGQSERSKGGILYQLKNGCNWEDLPKDLPPYSTVYWHYKQWRSAGAFEQLMSTLHEQVREQVKKSPRGRGGSMGDRTLQCLDGAL
jgi:transposase